MDPRKASPRFASPPGTPGRAPAASRPPRRRVHACTALRTEAGRLHEKVQQEAEEAAMVRASAQALLEDGLVARVA